MKKLITVIVAFIALGAYNATAQDDAKAKAILDELSAKTKSYSNIKATFSYNLSNPDAKIDETQEGTIHIKGSKYRLEIAGQEVISDGKTVWTYLKDANEVQINDMDASSEEAVTPSNIFTMYEKGFKYKFEGEKTEGGKVIQTIILYPIDVKGKPYHQVKLQIDKNAKQIQSIKVLSKDGNHYTYTVKTFTPNTDITDAHFTFNAAKYPKVEVIDLRD
ncbi:MAG: outer membrane lipoprotein carrier protein LolA [Bacteroidota bacterium]|nr:outer membrane lipoprotein carrier protein LolA [Bacteroidota bacterium]